MKWAFFGGAFSFGIIIVLLLIAFAIWQGFLNIYLLRFFVFMGLLKLHLSWTALNRFFALIYFFLPYVAIFVSQRRKKKKKKVGGQNSETEKEMLIPQSKREKRRVVWKTYHNSPEKTIFVLSFSCLFYRFYLFFTNSTSWWPKQHFHPIWTYI